MCTVTRSLDLLGGGRWCGDRGWRVVAGGGGRFGVSPATAHRWWTRMAAGERAPASSLAACGPLEPAAAPRGAARLSSASGSAAAPRDRLGAAADRRRDRRAAPDGLESAQRAGRSRRTQAATEPANRYEWPCPGDLLHMDTKRYARFIRPGHASPATAQPGRRRNARRSATSTPTRSSTTTPAWPTASCTPTSAQTPSAASSARTRLVTQHGITAKRVMTDNAWTYTRNRSLANCSPPRRPPPHASSPTDPRPTARSSASTRPWPANGPTASPTAHTTPRPALPHWLDHYKRATPPQRTRQPATHQPRTQPPKAGQLERLT